MAAHALGRIGCEEAMVPPTGEAQRGFLFGVTVRKPLDQVGGYGPGAKPPPDFNLAGGQDQIST